MGMNRPRRLLFAVWLPCALLLPEPPGLRAEPLALHPDNPHYFLFRGKPTILITSAEHYGAVLNLDFDYEPYLDELKANKLNLTRTFTGAYVEPQGAFNIAENTLAPAPGRFIAPWARTATPGSADIGNKFDLAQWNEAYFKRLKDFLTQARKRGVVVELNLFCPFYEETQWRLSPQNAENNVNGIGAVARTNVYTLDKHGGLLPVHEALTRKIVRELNGFDNLYYEICNEPYFGGVTLEWQHRIADVIAETEKAMRNQHLISRNVANGSAKVDNPHPSISIYNFHYAHPPTAVGVNYGLRKAIGDNETGFRGTNDLPYRVEAWEFITTGGGLYNNLDYSFTSGHEKGTFVYPESQPGGGNRVFRKQLRVLVDFMNGFNFVAMKPDNSVFANVPAGMRAHALAEPGRAYAIYLGPIELPKKGAPIPDTNRVGNLGLKLPAGTFQTEWLNTETGAVDKRENFTHNGGIRTLASPEFKHDIALRVVSASKQPPKKARPTELRPIPIKPLERRKG